MLALARELHRRGELPGDTVVGTVMSNMGFEKALEREGIRLLRAAVGDRYVLEAMRAGGYRFGGEQSGHVIDLARGTTGDGPMSAVALFSARPRGPPAAARAGRRAGRLPAGAAQRAGDRQAGRSSTPTVRAAVAAAERALHGEGRINVRPSGTEPLVRVMVEAGDAAGTRAIAEQVADVDPGRLPLAPRSLAGSSSWALRRSLRIADGEGRRWAAESSIPWIVAPSPRGHRAGEARLSLRRVRTLPYLSANRSRSPSRTAAERGTTQEWGERAGRRAGDSSARTRQLTPYVLKKEQFCTVSSPLGLRFAF